MGTPHGLSLAERFWIKVDRRAADECWPWTAHLKRGGYGAFGMGGKHGKVEMAHRVAWVLTNGEIPDGLHVDHKCRVRHCVNPEHLQLVTPALNAQNRVGLAGSRSGVRNVSWYAPYERWVVRLTVGGRRYHGGYYDTVEEAGVAALALRNRLQTNNLPDRAA